MLLLLVILFVSTFGITTKAQKNVIKANIFSPIVNTSSFFYERSISEKTSVQLGFYYTWSRPNFNVWGGTDTKWSGYGITPEFRYYPSGNGLDGFYLAPFFRYEQFKTNVTSQYGTYDSNGNYTSNYDQYLLIESAFGGGFLLGRQWIIAEFISVDSFIGPCLINRSTTTTNNNTSPYSQDQTTNIGLRFGLTIGVAF
ncbi:MAG: DUF3575 domain-containing protein [Flavobacteriales bacterium]|nr:DUF3575 domain-containing protein [Flavobacteriales bacterium]